MQYATVRALNDAFIEGTLESLSGVARKVSTNYHLIDVMRNFWHDLSESDAILGALILQALMLRSVSKGAETFEK